MVRSILNTCAVSKMGVHPEMNRGRGQVLVSRATASDYQGEDMEAYP